MLDAQHFGADRKAAEYKGLRGLHHDSDMQATTALSQSSHNLS